MPEATYARLVASSYPSTRESLPYALKELRRVGNEALEGLSIYRRILVFIVLFGEELVVVGRKLPGLPHVAPWEICRKSYCRKRL